MRHCLFAVLFILLLSGCTERYFNGKGAEYLVYPETHTYTFTVMSLRETQAQLVGLLQKVQEVDPGASYLFEYRTNQGKQVVTKAVAYFPSLPLAAESFVIQQSGKQSKDLKVTITYHALVTQKCDIPQIEGSEFSRNCFSEAARVRQVAHKERLVEGI